MTTSTKKMSALGVAEYFIDKANKDGKLITNKKLQKLVYYAQAWSVVLNNKPLFSDKIEAWVHGPAIKSLYVKYKDFGFNPIKKDISPLKMKAINSKTKELLDNIWSVYGKLDAGYLELLTHSEKPWQDARAGLESHTSSDTEITIASMKSYYSERLKETSTK